MSLDVRHYIGRLEQMGPVGEWAVNQLISLTVDNTRLKQQLQVALASLKQLDQQLEELQRQAHRQAAPFRRAEEERTKCPARPGRKAGHSGSLRPKPEQIDEHLVVPLEACPHCRGAVCDKHQLIQYIEEIPVVRPRVTELITEECWCAQCQREIYSTHPVQTSRAGGAAAVQLGPQALALASDLNKAKGLSMRKPVTVHAFGCERLRKRKFRAKYKNSYVHRLIRISEIYRHLAIAPVAPYPPTSC